MTKLPIALAAAALALGLSSSAEAAMSVHLSGAPSLVHKAGCWDEDCEEYLEALQEAREEAREAAAEAAEEYAEEAEEAAEEGYRPRRARRHHTRRARPAVTERAPKPQPVKAATPKASVKKRAVAVNTSPTTASCKQYSPATGMVLSVPCE
jgi:hypothetical protein